MASDRKANFGRAKPTGDGLPGNLSERSYRQKYTPVLIGLFKVGFKDDKEDLLSALLGKNKAKK